MTEHAGGAGQIQVRPEDLTQAGQSLVVVAAQVQGCARVLQSDCNEPSAFDGPAAVAYADLMAAWGREVGDISELVNQLGSDHVDGSSSYSGTESGIAGLWHTGPGRH